MLILKLSLSQCLARVPDVFFPNYVMGHLSVVWAKKQFTNRDAKGKTISHLCDLLSRSLDLLDQPQAAKYIAGPKFFVLTQPIRQKTLGKQAGLPPLVECKQSCHHW